MDVELLGYLYSGELQHPASRKRERERLPAEICPSNKPAQKVRTLDRPDSTIRQRMDLAYLRVRVPADAVSVIMSGSGPERVHVPAPSS